MVSKGNDNHGKIVREYYNEAGKMVRISVNGSPTFRGENSAAENEVASNFLRFILKNPSVLDTDVVSKGGSIQINFPD